MDTIVLRDSVTNSMTDPDFFKFCLENRDLKIERNNNLEVVIMSPVGTKGGFYSGIVFYQLSAWSLSQKKGFAFDSSSGFTLPDRSVFSPDASWVSKGRWANLSEQDKEGFAPLCPEFVIEVRSKADSINVLKTKMEAWMKNGCKLGWLIDPYDQDAMIYQAGKLPVKITGFKKITGEEPVAGFELDLSLLLQI